MSQCDCHVEIGRLQTKLNMERLKCKIYKQLIENQLRVEIEDGVDELINEIASKYAVSTRVKKAKRDESDDTSQGKKIPSCEKLSKVCNMTSQKILPFQDEVRIVFGEEVLERKVVEDNIAKLFDALRDAKTYNHLLMEIRNLRSSLQRFLSPNIYVELLHQHLDKVRHIFLQKNVPEKKIFSSIYPQLFTALEYRLLCLQGFHKQTMDVEDLLKFKLCNKLNMTRDCLETFESTKIANYVLNYCLALSSLEEIFQQVFVNAYGFNNIIFLRTQKHDDFLFYTLCKIDSDKRYWAMDCRLENLTVDLSECIKEYCICLFRTLYKASFDTNDYIPGFQLKSSLGEFECEQLIQNIVTATDFSKFNSVLRHVVETYCSQDANPGLDTFDLKTDDKTQMENFKKYKLSEQDIHDTLNRIFDDLDKDNLSILSKRFV